MSGLVLLPSNSLTLGPGVPSVTVDPSTGGTKLSEVKGDPLSSAVSTVPTADTPGSGHTGIPPSSPISRTIYSPTETGTWLTCPVLRQLKKSWSPRRVEWEPAILLGNAVQAGLSAHLRGGDDNLVESEVLKVLEEGFEDQPKYTLEGLGKLALRGVQATLDANLFHRHQVLMVDEPLSQSRPDVVSRHETEGLGVTDFKVSQKIDERYRQSRLSSYDTDDQFWHYAWEVGETLGEPVKWVRPVVIILSPKATVLTELTRVNPERLKFWLEGAEQHWRDMSAEDRGERPVVPRWPSCRGGRYGACEMYDACHLMNRDPRLMVTYYERLGN